MPAQPIVAHLFHGNGVLPEPPNTHEGDDERPRRGLSAGDGHKSRLVGVEDQFPVGDLVGEEAIVAHD